MKTSHLAVIILLWISFTIDTNAYGCTYCPAEPSAPHSGKLIFSVEPASPWYDRINGWVWVGMAVSGVTGLWILLFRRLKE